MTDAREYGNPKSSRQRDAASIAAATFVFVALWALALPAEVLTPATLQQAAEAFVQRTFRSEGELVVQCKPITSMGRLRDVEADIHARYVSTPNSSGPVIVGLEFRRDGKRIGQRSVTLDVRVFRSVLVARERLPRHTTLAADMLRVERREVRALGDGFFVDAADVVGKRVKSAVRAGVPILARAVEEIPSVERGDKVVILVHMGGIKVSARGTALRDGAVGSEVPVKNDRSGKRLQGIVVEPGVVRVSVAEYSSVGR